MLETINAYKETIAENEKRAKKYPALASSIKSSNLVLKVRLNQLEREYKKL